LKSDAEKWDAIYADRQDHSIEPDPLLTRWSHLLQGGRALDLACGAGANALYLARKGYWVDAVDISLRALRALKTTARKMNLAVGCIAADLDYWPIPSAAYDVVAVFFFFAPDRMPDLVDSLKSGGLIFYATYNVRHKSEKPGFNEAYLVPAHGLKPYFQSLDVLLDEPATGTSGNISCLIARKP